MDIQFYGANTISVTYKGTRIVVDDNLAELGAKSILKADDIALFTGAHQDVKVALKLMVDHPGEYEAAEVSVIGIAARAHMDEDGLKATMFKVMAGDLNLLFTGHIYPEITNAQLEILGKVDVMFIPVGGHGYTLDAVGAIKLIKAVEPKIIIPTHYADATLNYPVPQDDLAHALKELGMEQKEPVSRLKLKPADVGEVSQVIVLERT